MSPLWGRKPTAAADALEEPFEGLLELVGRGILSERKARKAIEQADVAAYADVDRLIRAAMNSAQAPPARAAVIGLADQRIVVRPNSLAYLLRRVFEEDRILGVPRRTVSELCVLAGRKIESIPVQYSFSSALSHALERDGARGQALRVWREFQERTPHEWARTYGEPLFLEVGVDEPRAFSPAEQQATDTLSAHADASRHAARTSGEYYGMRNLALAYGGAGRAVEALEHFDRAVELAPQVLDVTGRLLLFGDMLWLVICAKRLDEAQRVGTLLTDALGEAEPLVAHAGVFARSAMLCAMAQNPQAELAFLGRLPACLSC